MEADFSRREHGAGTACGSVGENMENDRHSCRQTGGQNSRQAGGGNNRQTDRQKGRQNYGQSGSIQGKR